MEVPLSINICRCCLAPGDYKSLKDTFQWMGENENYGDMLKECFDVTLCDANSGYRGGICELCITQLRNASNFKKQVLKSDELFKQGLENNFKSKEVKIEYENDVDSDIGNQDDYFGGLETEEETEIPVKEEITIEVKSRKRAIKVPVKREVAVKKKKSEADTSGKGANTAQNGSHLSELARCLRKLPASVTVKCNWNALMKCNEAVPRDTSTPLVCDRIDHREEEKRKKRRATRRDSDTVPEYLKHRANLTTLLSFSNVTPFKDRTVLGYLCAYCPESFPDPSDLKAHTNHQHDNERLTYKADTSIHDLTVLVDITDLRCTLCDAYFENLETLIDHLVETHKREYHRDVPDYIQPFKLTPSKEMFCCICFDVFDNFYRLAIHMNTHYRNFVCEVCGATFSNLSRLIRHEGTHENGRYPCVYCDKVYSTPVYKRNHEKIVHMGYRKGKCGICNQKFRSHYLKAKHMVMSHGAESLKCAHCDKVYFTKTSLNSHIRRSHLKEKTHGCDLCGRKFFLNASLQQHYRSHKGEKPFGCQMCDRRFSRRHERKLHMQKVHY